MGHLKLKVKKAGSKNPVTKQMGFAARVLTNGTAEFDDIVIDAAEDTTFNQDEIRAAAGIFCRSAAKMLKQGYIVDLGPIGKLYPTCSSGWYDKAEEMKLTDVARASLSELSNDYVNWLLQQDKVPWSIHSEEYKTLSHIPFDAPQYKDDVLYESSLHILAQKHKFDTWLNTNDSILVARVILVLCERLTIRIRKQIESQLASFTVEGGFTEALTAERLKHRTEQSISEDAPLCPKCGKPMIQRVAKKGTNSGKPFWSCSDYPNCHGTRKCE